MPRLIVHGSTLSLAPCVSRLLLVSVAVMVCSLLAHAQIDSTYIVAVDRIVQEIDAGKDYDLRTLENEEFLTQMTDGGGELKGFLKDGQLVKMVSWVGVSSCVYFTAYYFDRGQLVFVQEQGLEFAYVDSTGSFDPAVQNVTMVNRVYFRNGALAPVSQQGSTRCGGNSAPLKEVAWLLRDEAKRLKALLIGK